MGVSRSCTGAQFPGPGGKLGKKKKLRAFPGRKDGEISASLLCNVEAHECAAGWSPDLSHFAGVTRPSNHSKDRGCVPAPSLLSEQRESPGAPSLCC